jgi:hypothetical protein
MSPARKDGGRAADRPKAPPRGSRSALPWLVGLGLLAALAVWAVPKTVCEDLAVFVHWMTTDQRLGVLAGYRELPFDYPPLVRVILAGVMRLADTTSLAPVLALKVSLLAAFACTGVIFWAMTRRIDLMVGLLAGLFLDNVSHGYLDAFVIPPLLLAVWLMGKRRWSLALAVLSVSCLVKWQPLVLAPFFALHAGAAVRREQPDRFVARIFGRLALPAVAIPVAVTILFGAVVIRTLLLANRNPFLSGNALNLNWIYSVLLHVLGPDRHGPLGVGEVIIQTQALRWTLVPKIVFASAYLAILVRFVRAGCRDYLPHAIAAYLVYFFLNTGVHENHMIIVLPLFACMAYLRRAWIRPFVVAAVFANLNLIYFYGLAGDESAFPKSVAGAWLACAVVILASLVVVRFWRELARSGSRESGPERWPSDGTC